MARTSAASRSRPSRTKNGTYLDNQTEEPDSIIQPGVVAETQPGVHNRAFEQTTQDDRRSGCTLRPGCSGMIGR